MILRNSEYDDDDDDDDDDDANFVKYFNDNDDNTIFKLSHYHYLQQITLL